MTRQWGNRATKPTATVWSLRMGTTSAYKPTAALEDCGQTINMGCFWEAFRDGLMHCFCAVRVEREPDRRR